MEQIASVVHGHVRRAVIRGDGFRVVRILALPDKHCGHAFAPSFFDGGVDAQFVVHQHVVFGRVTPYDIRQSFLLVHINQDMTLTAS